MPSAIIRGFAGPLDRPQLYLRKKAPHPETGEMRYRFKIRNHTFVIDSPDPDPWGKDWVIQVNRTIWKNKLPDGSKEKITTGIKIKLSPIPQACSVLEGVLEWIEESSLALHVCAARDEGPIIWVGSSIDSSSQPGEFTVRLIGILRLI